MSETYYRYNSDDAVIDLENDEIYDYVLEREELKKLDLVGPKCIRNFGGEYQEEHFGNLHGMNNSFAKNLFVIILVLLLIYFGYTWCKSDDLKLKNVPYRASFSY